MRKFVGQAASEFAPCSDAFGLHQLFLLRGQGVGHVVEGAGELADFVAALDVDVRVPAAGGDITSAIGELFDRTGDARERPTSS